MIRSRPLCAFCTVLLCIMAVWAWAAREKVPPAIGGRAQVSGLVTRREERESTQVLYLTLSEHSDFGSGGLPSGAGLLIYDSDFTPIKTGESIQVKGEMKSLERARNPGNFDSAAYYMRQGIYGTMFADTCQVIKPCPKGADGFLFRLLEKLYVFRSRWKKCLTDGAGEKTGGILGAILLGEKTTLAPEQKELYQKSGIGHILAISGLHISFIGLGVYRLLRKAGVSCMGAGVIAMTLLLFYMGMTGAAVSIVRAVLMLGIRIGADVSGRPYDMATSLSVAGVLTALWKPYAVLEAGFLFSYGAVAGILWLGAPLGGCAKGKLSKAFLGSFGIQAFLLPVTRLFYYEIPAYAVLLNLVVIPLLSGVMALGLSGSLLYVLWPPAGRLFLLLAGGILKLYDVLCEGSLFLPGARVVCGIPAGWQMAVCYGLLALGRRRVLQNSRKAAVMLFLAAVLAGSIQMRLPGRMEVTAVDVGQGDSLYIESPNGECSLVDGGSSDVKEVGKYRLESFLEAQGAGTLEYVFVSHGDSDHINGITELLKRKKKGIRIKALVLPDGWEEQKALCALAREAKKAGSRVLCLRAGQTLSSGPLTFTCLGPVHPEGREANENSMVLHLRYKRFQMLLTGDTEKDGEKDLLRLLQEEKEKGRDIQMTVLKAAHHGSRNSTGETFLELTSPRVAFISAGTDNSYGHPHPETVERLRKSGCTVYETAREGALSIYTDGTKVKIKTYLKP